MFVQQAAAAKCVGMLAKQSNQLANTLVQVGLGFVLEGYIFAQQLPQNRWMREGQLGLLQFISQNSRSHTNTELATCTYNASSFFQMRVTHNLLYAMGNVDYADSQRQASLSLEVNK